MTNISVFRGKESIATIEHSLGSFDVFRQDAYVNLTQMAKLFPGKRLDNWTRLKSTQEYIQAVQESECDRFLKQAVLTVRGRNLSTELKKELQNKYGVTVAKQGTYAHHRIAVQFQAWLESKRQTRSDFVYLIADTDRLFCKIGIASDPTARLKEIQVCCPLALELIAVKNGGKSEESRMHCKYKRKAVRGEWFFYDKKILNEFPKNTWLTLA